MKKMNYHKPVLLNESINGLITDKSGVYVDVTFGGGGHSKGILDKLSDNAKLFSFDQDNLYNLLTLIIAIITIVILIMIINNQGFKKYALLMILGGALGNLFDRIIYKAVPDFIDFHIAEFHWFIFNVADIFISIGIICLIFAELLNYKKINEK